MRAVALAFTVGAGLFGQAPPELDVVLLVEDSIPATSLARRSDWGALTSGDRVAVMTFSSQQSLKLAFEEDWAIIDLALGKLDSKGTRSDPVRLWDAVARAAGLFGDPPDPSVRRAIFVVFSTEDNSDEQTPESVRAALARSEASLSAVTIWTGRPSVPAPPPILQIPNRPTPQTPGVWSERVPPKESSVLDDTIRSVEWLARETGGLRLKSEWDFTRLIERARR